MTATCCPNSTDNTEAQRDSGEAEEQKSLKYNRG